MNTKRKKNILLVDDDPFLQSLYCKTLEREGFNILVAEDGEAALRRLPENPDLIVLDLMLPKLDGMKVLATIRADARHKELPVLILSNAYLPNVAQNALAAGANAGLMKSECSPKKLVRIIRETLRTAAVPAVVKLPQPAAGKNSWIPGMLRSKGNNSDSSPAENAASSIDDDSSLSDPEISAEFKNELLKSWPTEIAMIRGICLKYVKAANPAEAEEQLKEIYRRLRLVGARAAMAEWFRVSQLSGAIEAMLFEHGFKLDKNKAQSVVQTMFQAVDCLERLFKGDKPAQIESTAKIKILLVDDDPVCNKANEMALKRMSIETVCVADGETALCLVEKNAYDLILLDVEMPGLSGFDVCRRLRKLPQCKLTPVVFVTALDDFQSRAQSVLCGGNGLISKPISPLELIVRTLTFLLNPQGAKQPTDVPPSISIKLAAEKQAAEKPVAPLPVPAKLVSEKPVAEKTTAASEPAKSSLTPPKIELGVPGLKLASSSVDGKIKELTEALAEETRRREAAEQLAAEQAKAQSLLESERVESQKMREHLQQMLEEAQRQNGQPGKPVEPKVQTKSAHERATDCAKRMGEYESSLAEIRKAREKLLQDLESAGSPERRTELELAMTENERSEGALVKSLEEAWQEFEACQIEDAMGPSSVDISSSISGPTPEVFGKKTEDIAQALDAATKRSEAAERQVAEFNEKRSALEAELAASAKAQEELRAQLSEQQQKLDAQVQAHQAEVGQLAGRTKELEASRTEVEEKVKSLTETLAAETQRSQTSEKQVAEIEERRRSLESELLSSKEAQAQLREQLSEQQKRLDSQANSHNSEVGSLADRTKELEAGRAAVEEKVKSLTEALAAETKRSEAAEKQAAEITQRRTEIEAELATSSEAQNQLRGQLAEQQARLEAQIQAHQSEIAQLSARTKELESSSVSVEETVKTLTSKLTEEAKRSETAEQQVSEISQRRSALESELSASNQAQAELRSQLAEQQKKLEAQTQAHNADIGNFDGRTKELEANCSALEEKLKSLTKELTAETKRSKKAEQQAAEISDRRNALEEQLAANNEALAKFRKELEDQNKVLESRVQTDQVESEKLTGRIKDLETSCAELEEKLKSLTKSHAAETKRSEKAEKKAAELGERREAIEAELAAGNQAQEQLRAQLAEQQKNFEAQIQTQRAEIEALSGQTGKLEKSCAELQSKIDAQTKTLASETRKSQHSEQLALEITQRRNALEFDLAASNHAQADLRAQMADLQTQHDSQIESRRAEIETLTRQAKELAASQAAVEENVKSLTEKVATETKRAEAAERQMAEAAEKRLALEGEIAAGRELQSQLNAQITNLQGQLETETQKWQSENGQLTSQIQGLEKSFAAETKRAEAVERQMAEAAEKRTALENEIAAGKQLQSQLNTQISDLQGKLETEAQKRESENRQFTSQVQQLEAACAEVEGKVKSLTQALEAEVRKSESAERHAADAGQKRAALESELAGSTQALSVVRTQLAQQKEQLEARIEAANAGFEKASAEVKNLEANRGVQEEKINALTQALSAEMKRAQTSGELAADTEKKRAALATELAANVEAQGRLQAQITEQQQQLHLVSAELEGFRRCAQEEALRQKKLVAKIAETEKALADLNGQLDSVQALAATRENQINGLNLDLKNLRETHSQLEANHTAEAARRQDVEGKLGQVQAQFDETTRQLAQKSDAEKALQARESELQALVNTQQADLAKSKETIATLEQDLSGTKVKLEEGQILQTVLCSKIQVLTDQGQADTKKIQDLETRAVQADATDKQLAGLRYALLDASRLSTKLQAERLKLDRQSVEMMQKMLASLLQTPLSMTQRGLLAEVQHSMEGFNSARARATHAASPAIELPNFHASQFTLAEVIESAFSSVRLSAKAAGVSVNAHLSDETSGRVRGFAEHLHQLITLMTISPLTVIAGVRACDLRVEARSSNPKSAEITLKMVFSSDGHAQELIERFNTVAAAVQSSQTGGFSDAEYGLAAGWQLAMAMGLQPAVEQAGENDVCLKVPMTLEAEPAAANDKTTGQPPVQKTNLSGNGHSSRKAKSGAPKVDESCAVAD